MSDVGNSLSPFSEESAHQLTLGKQELGYDVENARKELVKAIIMHEYPLSIVDHVGFKRYSAAL